MTSGPPKHNIPDSAHEEPSRGCLYFHVRDSARRFALRDSRCSLRLSAGLSFYWYVIHLSSSALLQPNIQAHVFRSLQNLRTRSPAGIPTCPCMLKYRASSFLNYLPVLYAAISWQPIVVPYGAILSRPPTHRTHSLSSFSNTSTRTFAL